LQPSVVWQVIEERQHKLQRAAEAEKEAKAMRCRCGNEILHVPEHLRDLASWVCQKCTNTAPRGALGVGQEPIRRQIPWQGRKKKAA